MSFSHPSPAIHFLMEEDRRVLNFRFTYRDQPPDKPESNECQGIISAVCLDYAFCGEQDYGITGLLEGFDAVNEKMTIRKTPIETRWTSGIYVLKYGSGSYITKGVIDITKRCGVIGCWDESSFAICIASQYKCLFDSLQNLFIPNKTQFAFGEGFAGRHSLIIMSI